MKVKFLEKKLAGFLIKNQLESGTVKIDVLLQSALDFAFPKTRQIVVAVIK